MVYFAIEDCTHIAQNGEMKDFIIYFNNLRDFYLRFFKKYGQAGFTRGIVMRKQAPPPISSTTATWP
ncbi:hypothetical protein [Phyllobacterium sp. P30BS-XVII]|uniref:hypothetical protein n=1 Tax=Phyllobacterium sp. P30BS-XVII TaxID=2587046 RepID=UPI0015FA7A93|nr:hypothetical protein [Phyllobacterium sp. P30BS-XVII]MBA8901886.1 hypothetical protein [Phyllobacterium sp. P30BS-XVII]